MLTPVGRVVAAAQAAAKARAEAESRPAFRLPDAGPLGVMLNPVSGGSVLSDRSTLGLRMREMTGIESIPVLQPVLGLKLGSPELEALLDRETKSVARPGNLVEVLPHGQRAFEARGDIAAMARPGESLHQQTFVNRNDGVGWRNARMMMQHARNVGPARHIYDAVGSEDAVGAGTDMFRLMARAGVEVEAVGDGPDDWMRHVFRWHEKLFLLHNHVGILGGINLTSECGGVPGADNRRFKLIRLAGLPFMKKPIVSVGEPWHDMDFMIRGPVVADMQYAFTRTWLERGHHIPDDLLRELTDPYAIAPHIGGGRKVRFIQHRPWEDGDDYITAAWVRLIDATEGPIHIENPYFSPPQPVLDALKRAVARGYPVTVLTSAVETIDFKIAYHAGSPLHEELIRAGVRIFVRSPMVHAKVMTLAGKYTVGGSANMNGRSRFRDTESVVVIECENVTKQCEDTIKNLLDSARELTLESLASASFEDKILQVAGRALKTHV